MAQNPRVSGRQQFAYYSVDAGVTWNRFGRETGGGPTIDPALRHRMELGGVDTMVGGLISGEFTLEFDIGHGGIFPTGAAGITPNYVLRERSVAAGLYPDTTLEVDGNGDGVLWVGIGLGLVQGRVEQADCFGRDGIARGRPVDGREGHRPVHPVDQILFSHGPPPLLPRVRYPPAPAWGPLSGLPPR